MTGDPRRSKLAGWGSTALVLSFLAMGLNPANAQARCPGLKALNGKCSNVLTVEDAQQRALVVTTVRNSYFGTPAGAIGGIFIPFERLFRDDPVVFGLPTHEFISNHTPMGGNTFIIHRTK